MTIGEKIQYFRKERAMSQEELGQKLLVSRQTVSLWEKGQTAPTIDNLLRLKDIFGVSVDELLCAETPSPGDLPSPTEIYRFAYSKEELSAVYSALRKTVCRRPACFVFLCLLFLFTLVAAQAPKLTIYFVLGFSLAGSLWQCRQFFADCRAWKTWCAAAAVRQYECCVFSDAFTFSVLENDVCICRQTLPFQAVEAVQNLKTHWLFIVSGTVVLLRKSDLAHDSAFYTAAQSVPTRFPRKAPSGRWRTVSTLLFIGALCSILGALLLVGMVSRRNHLFVSNMWLFFLMTPLPLASVVFGFFLRAKGCRYKKNVIAGILIFCLLCIYGSFSFLLSEKHTRVNTPTLRATQYIGVEPPAPEKLTAQIRCEQTTDTGENTIRYVSE